MAIRHAWRTLPAPRARLARYAGGDPDIDAAIVELHNRSHRPSRLTLPASREQLWMSAPGLTAHEYVLVWDEDRLVGYTEWLVTDGKPYINSLVVARSHWGTQVATAAAYKAMRILIALGHRKLESSVISTNAPSMKLHLKLGWRVAAELIRTCVRKV